VEQQAGLKELQAAARRDHLPAVEEPCYLSSVKPRNDVEIRMRNYSL
jgi:hypothetical protein